MKESEDNNFTAGMPAGGRLTRKILVVLRQEQEPRLSLLELERETLPATLGRALERLAGRRFIPALRFGEQDDLPYEAWCDSLRLLAALGRSDPARLLLLIEEAAGAPVTEEERQEVPTAEELKQLAGCLVDVPTRFFSGFAELPPDLPPPLVIRLL